MKLFGKKEKKKKIKKKKKLYRSVTRKLSLVLILTFALSVAVTYSVLSYYVDMEAYLTAKEGLVDVLFSMLNQGHEAYQLKTIDTAEQLANLSTDEQLEFITSLPENEYRVCVTDSAGTVTVANHSTDIGRDLSQLTDLKEQSLTYQKDSPVKDFDGNTDIYIYAAKKDDGYLVSLATVDEVSTLVTEKYTSTPNCVRVGVFGWTVVLNSDKNITNYVTGYLREDDEYVRKLTDIYDVMPTDEEFPGLTVKNLEEYQNGNILECKYYFDSIGYYCCIRKVFSVYIVSGYPVFDAYQSIIFTVVFTVLAEILIFIVIYIAMRVILWRTVAIKIDAVNASLDKITDGDLEERVDVRSTLEFDSLSDDINTMVDRLKGYIAEAEARYDADLAVAKEIQQSALPYVFPPFPERTEFDLYATMHAAKEVGGDFYDFYMLDDNTLGFLIADVSGKSIPGAMFMMRAKSVIKSLAESGLPPDEVFAEANDSLCANNEAEMFVTAWLGYLELDTGLVSVANAGHNPPLLIHGGNAEYQSLKPGLILGELDGIPYKEQQVRLEEGDMLFLYTDGVTEAMNKENKLYGEDRLKEVLSFGNVPPENDGRGETAAICRMVAEDVALFADGAEQSDDITMLCIKYCGRRKDERA